MDKIIFQWVNLPSPKWKCAVDICGKPCTKLYVHPDGIAPEILPEPYCNKCAEICGMEEWNSN